MENKYETSDAATCARCSMERFEWSKPEGVQQAGKTFCCVGCAENTGCICETIAVGMQAGTAEFSGGMGRVEGAPQAEDRYAGAHTGGRTEKREEKGSHRVVQNPRSSGKSEQGKARGRKSPSEKTGYAGGKTGTGKEEEVMGEENPPVQGRKYSGSQDLEDEFETLPERGIVSRGRYTSEEEAVEEGSEAGTQTEDREYTTRHTGDTLNAQEGQQDLYGEVQRGENAGHRAGGEGKKSPARNSPGKGKSQKGKKHPKK